MKGRERELHVYAGRKRLTLRENEFFIDENDGNNEKIHWIEEKRRRNAMELLIEVVIDPDVHVEH